jgi:NADH:ubiquinone oxidoreductase subunit E
MTRLQRRQRKAELLEALHSLREREGHVLSALMVTVASRSVV